MNRCNVRNLIVFMVLFLGNHFAFADTLNDLLFEAERVKSSEIKKFERLLEEIETRQSELTDYQKGLYSTLHAYKLSIRGNYQEALSIQKRLFESTRFDDLKYRAAFSLINIYGVVRDFYSGAMYINELNAIAANIPNNSILDTGDVVKTLFYQEAGQYELAVETAQQLLTKSLSPKNECAVRSVFIASSYQLDPESVDFNFVDDAQRFCINAGEGFLSNFVAISKVRLLIDKNSISLAKDELSRIEKSTLSTRYPRLIAEFYAVKGRAQIRINNPVGAVVNANKALENSQKAEFNKPAVEAYLVLSDAEKLNGNFEQALDYHKQYVIAEKAYEDQRFANHLAFQRARFEYELSQRSLEIVKKENALLASEAETAKQEAQTGIVLVIFSTSALLVVFIWLYRTNRIKQQFKLLAEMDSLTGINNRHKFFHSAMDAITFCQKNGQSVSMVIMDLDHFKAINDSYGHTTGDEVLKLVADVLGNECRNNDIVGRLGGEEFGILLPGCTGEKAVEIANDLRKKIEVICTKATGHDFEITASFGVASSDNSAVTYDDLFSQADSALYRSKNEGRNCVYLASAAA